MKLNIKVREIMKGKLYETLIGTDARPGIHRHRNGTRCGQRQGASRCPEVQGEVIAEEVKVLEQTYNEMQSANEELVKSNDLLKKSVEEQESTIEKQRSEISELRTQYDQVSEMVTNTYLDTKEQATVTIKEYDKVSGYADEPLKKDAEEVRRDTLRDDSKVLAQRNVLLFIFKHFQPELVEKLARIGLKDIVGKSSWERAREDYERSQSQEIRRGLKL